MTIREVLDADWTVDEIDVTVRDRKSTEYIMGYRIGRDVKPGRSERFLYGAECGDVYGDSRIKTLFIKRIIQFRQKEKKSQGKEMCVGVLLEEIPKEILELEVDHMYPYKCGRSDGMHGYDFECYVDRWCGIPGEDKQINLELN